MKGVTALDDDMARAAETIGPVELLVGIPSYRNAATIGHVARTVREGLSRSFGGMRVAVVNSDGGSEDGTRDRVAEALDGTPRIVGRYVGLPGKGSAFRAIFELAGRLNARACAVVDSDLRSITPEWIQRLLAPIVEDRADYVAPLYARHKHDGTITNTIAYPLTRALYGLRVRQPIGGEFGFSGALARDFLEGGAFVPQARRPSEGEAEHLSAREESPRPSVQNEVWEGDVARFGIDIYMTTTALVRGARVAQAFLGAKVHDPKDPGADLGPMFRQVVGTAFRLAAANRAKWAAVKGSREAPVLGDVHPVDPEEVRADAALLVRRFGEGATEHGATWDASLSKETRAAVRRAMDEAIPHALAGETWARVVYDMLAASARDPSRTAERVTALVPLYFGRVAAFIDDARDMTTAGSERLVEDQALAFEAAKAYLSAQLAA
ncbi:MAG: glycosyltransferase [Chloroflexi bacterium]|nr:glycosyltransferase [Chloroflexota bacterium]